MARSDASTSLRAAERVEGRRGDEGVDAEARRAFRLVDHAHGLHVDDAAERDTRAVDDGDRLLQHMMAARRSKTPPRREPRKNKPSTPASTIYG